MAVVELPPVIALIDFLLIVDQLQRPHEQLQKVAQALMVRLLPACARGCLFMFLPLQMR